MEHAASCVDARAVDLVCLCVWVVLHGSAVACWSCVRVRASACECPLCSSHVNAVTCCTGRDNHFDQPVMYDVSLLLRSQPPRHTDPSSGCLGCGRSGHAWWWPACRWLQGFSSASICKAGAVRGCSSCDRPGASVACEIRCLRCCPMALVQWHERKAPKLLGSMPGPGYKGRRLQQLLLKEQGC